MSKRSIAFWAWDWVDGDAQRGACPVEWLVLTRYGFPLLATLLKRPQHIFARGELMNLVWADAPDAFKRRVDAHIKLLCAKLRERGASPDLIQTRRDMGCAMQGSTGR